MSTRRRRELRDLGIEYGVPMHRALDPSGFMIVCGADFHPEELDPVLSINGPRLLPTQVILSKIEQKGWVWNKKKKTWLCPEHINHFNVKCEEIPVKNPVPLKVIETASVDKVPDGKVLRAVMTALDLHFDENSRRYKTPHSDETIAVELGLSPIFIAKMRREAYGELAENIELMRIQSALQKLTDEISQVETKALEAIDRLLNPLRDKQAALIRRVEALENEA